MARNKDTDWSMPAPGVGGYEAAQLAVLMDLRDELKKLNTLLHCSNFQRIPFKLDAIRRNTTKPRKKKKVT